MTNVQWPIAEARMNWSLAIGDSLKTLVGAESAALSASRMSSERSAGELRFRNGAGERNRTVVSALARPHSAVEPHPQKWCPQRDSHQQPDALGRARSVL